MVACNLLGWHKIMVSFQSMKIPFSFTYRTIPLCGIGPLERKSVCYDSCFSGIHISSSMQAQLSMVCKSILQPGGPGKKTVTIEYPGVCKQIGGKGCGVFAIAFTFHAGV